MQIVDKSDTPIYLFSLEWNALRKQRERGEKGRNLKQSQEQTMG